MTKKNLLPLDLQLFSQDPPTDPPATPPTLSAENVTAFISQNPDYLANILGTELGKKHIDSIADKRVNQGIETWKANNLDKIVNERVETLFPNESPQAKQMREMQAQIDRINQEKLQAEMATKTLNLLSQEGVPNTFARFLQGQDEATTKANIADFKAEFMTALNGSVDSKFKQFSHQPQNNFAQNHQQQSQAKDPNKMSYSERMELFNSNPNEYKRIFG